MSPPFRRETEMDETTTRAGTNEIERAKRNARRFAEMKRQVETARAEGMPGERATPTGAARSARNALLLRG